MEKGPCLNLAASNPMRPSAYSYVRLEPIDAALVPLWYRLPESSRDVVRRLVLTIARSRLRGRSAQLVAAERVLASARFRTGL